MPQNATGMLVGKSPTGGFVALACDAEGVLETATANNSTLYVTTETLVKASAGVVYAVSVVTAGTTVGAVYDAATIGNAGTATLVAQIGTAVGITQLGAWPMQNGIVVNPGSGMAMSVAFT